MIISADQIRPGDIIETHRGWLCYVLKVTGDYIIARYQDRNWRLPAFEIIAIH